MVLFNLLFDQNITILRGVLREKKVEAISDQSYTTLTPTEGNFLTSSALVIAIPTI